MNEITILDTPPVIITKNVDWAKHKHKAEPGSIILLPEDAILVIVPAKEVQPS